MSDPPAGLLASVAVTVPPKPVETFPYGSSMAAVKPNDWPTTVPLGGSSTITNWLGAAGITWNVLVERLPTPSATTSRTSRRRARSIVRPEKVATPCEARSDDVPSKLDPAGPPSRVTVASPP